MPSPSVSLIIVSRDRPDGLRKTLTSLRFQTYANFEVIVVSNALPDIAHGDFKFVAFDKPNISAARNLGLAQAAGDIVAFCDDDAVPEPQWLERLVTGFVTSEVGIAGGFVRGRNGISFQWKGVSTDLNGDDTPITTNKDVSVHAPIPQRFVRPVGTNCAFRADAIQQVGGFDPSFAFFLDETELCLRLARAGWATAIVPLAEVQHGYAASAGRKANRVPIDLFQIGVSKSVFVAAYGDMNCLDKFRADQKSRLVEHMTSGRIEPRDVGRLLARLDAGLKLGQSMKLAAPNIEFAQTAFKTCFESPCTKAVCTADQETAKKMSDAGVATTMIQISRTSLFHKRGFDDRGYWLQTGGQFGRSERSDPLWSFHRMSARIALETERMSDQRVFDKTDKIFLK